MTYDNFILLRIRICITKDQNKRVVRETLTEQDNGNKGLLLKDSNWVSRLTGRAQARKRKNKRRV